MTLLFLRAWFGALDRITARRDERGQTTAEYALVIIGVAAIAGLLLAWASKSHAITKLFDSVIDQITP
jgi:Flp pilus assembly pilin Flp